MFVLKIYLSNYSLLPAAAAVSILDGREFVGMERIREDSIFIYLGAYGFLPPFIAITNQSCCR